ncbi:MAG TPA: pyridoxal-phosphate dependent enzyme, partial [Symbiobacteriaceae bacterium]|nr:pyridoxal-phosphate dependent enzyme [Symbiobacteriaceae bacterium]
RKLEYLLGEAVAAGATHVLTTGGPQSNHARATAAAAARLGLQCVLVLAGQDPGAREGNLLLDKLFGAEIRFPGAITPEDQARGLETAAAEIAAAGGRPYVIPVGGSTPMGCLGSYRCYAELAAALPGDAWVCTTTGSAGTHAGLALGALTHGKAVRVQGFSVWQSAAVLEPLTRSLVREAAALLDIPVPEAFPVYVDDGYLAPRYGRASQVGLEAIELVAGLEGIVLDHVYTGKAMAGTLDYIRRGIIPQGARVVFVHTGGAPAIFAGMR